MHSPSPSPSLAPSSSASLFPEPVANGLAHVTHSGLAEAGPLIFRSSRKPYLLRLQKEQFTARANQSHDLETQQSATTTADAGQHATLSTCGYSPKVAESGFGPKRWSSIDPSRFGPTDAGSEVPYGAHLQRAIDRTQLRDIGPYTTASLTYDASSQVPFPDEIPEVDVSNHRFMNLASNDNKDHTPWGYGIEALLGGAVANVEGHLPSIPQFETAPAALLADGQYLGGPLPAMAPLDSMYPNPWDSSDHSFTPDNVFIPDMQMQPTWSIPSFPTGITGQVPLGNRLIPRTPCSWPFCMESFARPSDLDRHIQSVHLGIKYHCYWPGCSNNCGKGYCRLEKLRSHQRQKHGFA